MGAEVVRTVLAITLAIVLVPVMVSNLVIGPGPSGLHVASTSEAMNLSPATRSS